MRENQFQFHSGCKPAHFGVEKSRSLHGFRGATRILKVSKHVINRLLYGELTHELTFSTSI